MREHTWAYVSIRELRSYSKEPLRARPGVNVDVRDARGYVLEITDA